MKPVLILFLSCFLSHVYAQDDVSKPGSYNELFKLYRTYEYKDAPKALTYIVEAKDVAEAKNNQEKLATAYYYIAKCYNKLGENKKALIHIETAISKSIAVSNTVSIYKSYSLKGDIFSELGDDSKALIWYLTSMEYAKILQNPIYELPVLSNLANIKKVHKDFEESIDLNKQILQKINTLQKDQNTKVYELSALMNIADAYLWLQNPAEANTYNTKALELCEDQQPAWLYYPTLMNKAIIHYQNAEYTSCISTTKEVKAYAEANQKANLYHTTLFYLGKSTYKQQDYEKSITYLTKAIDSITISDNVDVNEKELHEFLALGYNKLGNAEKSLVHFEKYAALEKAQSKEDLKINNQTHELVDMVPLQSEINILGAALTKQTHTRKKLLIAFIFVLILLITSIIYYKKREKRTQVKFKQLLTKVAALEKKENKKALPKKGMVSDDQMKILLEKISDFEDKEYFLLQECSLGFMAEKLQTNTSYISKAINKYRGKSFTSYITELRIKTALVRLKNDKILQSYTIKAIAEEFGFKRQETFSKAFKSYTGIYPSQYVKNLKKSK